MAASPFFVQTHFDGLKAQTQVRLDLGDETISKYPQQRQQYQHFLKV